VEIVTLKNEFINLEHGLTAPDTLPKQLTALHTVYVSDRCNSVCSYQGNTYVGIWGGRVEMIDENNQLSQVFARIDDPVQSVAVYKDRLYTLVSGNPYTVTVHNLTGNLITSWTHADDKNRYSKLGIVSDQVVIPDRGNKRLTVYSLTGEVIKHIQCPLLSPNWVSMCAIDNLSVVVSDYDSSKVISSGEVEWTSQDVPKPQGVAYYAGRVFATNRHNTTRVWILDVNTGYIMYSLTYIMHLLIYIICLFIYIIYLLIYIMYLLPFIIYLLIYIKYLLIYII